MAPPSRMHPPEKATCGGGKKKKLDLGGNKAMALVVCLLCCSPIHQLIASHTLKQRSIPTRGPPTTHTSAISTCSRATKGKNMPFRSGRPFWLLGGKPSHSLGCLFIDRAWLLVAVSPLRFPLGSHLFVLSSSGEPCQGCKGVFRSANRRWATPRLTLPPSSERD